MKNRIKYRNKCVLYIQKIVRGFLARKQHQPRYRGIAKIKSVKENLRRSTDIVNQLRGGQELILKQANDIENLINASVRNIQNDAHINPKTIDKIYTDILTKVDNFNNMIKKELQKQRQAEEQDRLRKIQEALEAERKQKEDEERKAGEEEENRRK